MAEDDLVAAGRDYEKALADFERKRDRLVGMIGERIDGRGRGAQTEVARRLGWTRQRVNSILRRRRGSA